jgi:hypothetical protein
MPLRGEINSAIPQIQEPVGYVTINGVKYPVEQSNPHRRLDESVWERLGGFEDLPYQLGLGNEVSLAQVQALDDRLSQLEAQSGEVRDASDFEGLRAEIEALRAQVGAGQSELQAANDALQALNSRVQEESDLQALRRGGQGALSDLDSVDTDQINSDAVTTVENDSTATDVSLAVSTNVSLHTDTISLDAASKAVIVVSFSQNALFGTAANIQISNSGIGSDRYVYLELVRDPGGSPVVLVSQDVAAPIPASTNLTLTAAANIGFTYNDTGHGGGSVTYGLRLVSYTAADKLTAAGSNIGVTNLRRNMLILQAKR